MGKLLPALLALASVCAAKPEVLDRDWGRPLPLSRVRLICPDEQARQALSDGLSQAGCDVVVTEPRDAMAEGNLRWKPETSERTVLVVGGIHTNRAMLPLYSDYLAFGDAWYPGAGGFTIRTIAEPLGEGTAAVCLEASDDSGALAAAKRLLELIDRAGLSIAPTVEAHLSDECLKASRVAPQWGMRYVMTGDTACIPKAVEALRNAATPGSGWYPHGDYGIERWVREYGLIQDAPGVSAEDIRFFDQALLDTLIRSENDYWRARGGRSIGSRHQTMGTSCFTAALSLLRRRGAPSPEAQEMLDKWWGQCVEYWTNACATFHDDIEGLPSHHSPEPILDWALQFGFAEYLERQLPLAALRSYSMTDNLGYYGGAGTYEECRPGDVYKSVPRGWIMQVAAFFHPDAGFDWLCENTPDAYLQTWALGRNFVGMRRFVGAQATGRQPGELLGIRAVPLGPYRYARLSPDRATALATGGKYIPAPLERTFEKLCLRDSFDPNGQYLVFQGWQGSSADNLPPLDANCLIRFTDLGHVWLHANSEKSGKLPRTGVMCSDGFNEAPEPAGCDLQAVHNGAKVGLFASRLSDFVACDWTRNVVWRRGRYFVMIDLLRQTADAASSLICSFRTPQRARLSADGMTAREGTAFMQVRNADGARLSLSGGDELEGAAIPTILREGAVLDGGPGGVAAFRNLVFAADPEHPADLEIRPVGDQAAIMRGTVRGEEELALVAAALEGQSIEAGGIRSDARVLYVGLTDWAQAGGTGVSVGGQRLNGDEGASPDAVREALLDLWQSAQPAQFVQSGGQTSGQAKPAWSYDGFTTVPAAADAPVLTCAPAPEGNLASLLDGVVTRWATCKWPAQTDVTLDIDLREPVRIRRIDFQTGPLGRFNTIPDLSAYPAPKTVVAEFSETGFGRDIRARELTFTSDCTFEGLHKGSVFPTLRWSCADVGERARYLRLTFPAATWAPLAMNELSVRPDGDVGTRVVGMIARDVTGDGSADILAWSDRGELVALTIAGDELWRRTMGGYITAVECYPDLTHDGPRVLVTTREARLYCLDSAGAEVWKTDFLSSAKMNTDLPTAYSIGLIHDREGRPVIVTGNYNLASFVSPSGELLKYRRLPAAYQTLTLSRGGDFNGDGLEEILSSEVWGCLSLLSADMETVTPLRLPRGRGILLETLEPPTSERAKAVICTENGAGILDLKTLKYDWLHGVQPVSDCAVGDIDGDGRPEVALAKEDGYVIVYREDGALLRSVLVGEPVAAITLTTGRENAEGAQYILALPGRLGALDGSGAMRDFAPGDYVDLLWEADARMLIARGRRATVDAYRLP